MAQPLGGVPRFFWCSDRNFSVQLTQFILIFARYKKKRRVKEKAAAQNLCNCLILKKVGAK